MSNIRKIQFMDQSESKIQSECYIYFHNSFPHLRGLLCYNLNNSKNKVDGALNKALGLQKGRSDMVLYYQGRAYMLEFKTPTGILGKDQKEWQLKVSSHGFEYLVIRSLENFKDLLAKLGVLS